MKKLFLLILPLLAISFSSCSKDDDTPNYEELIVGTWDATHINGTAWTFEATSFTLSADKKYSFSGYLGNSNGTYTINGKKIIFTDIDSETGEQWDYGDATIISINGNEAEFSTTVYNNNDVIGPGSEPDPFTTNRATTSETVIIRAKKR